MRSFVLPAVLVGLVLVPAGARAQGSADTIRIDVGSPLVDGRLYKPHAARVRVHVGDASTPVANEWTNILTLGDSAGRPVQRWVTLGRSTAPDGGVVTSELRQTYDAVSLKPLGYLRTTSRGLHVSLAIDGNRVRGTRRQSADAKVDTVDIALDRAGFFSGSTDLIPAALGFKAGKVIVFPVWSPNSTKVAQRIFTIVGEEPTMVEGTQVKAWKVEERNYDDKRLLSTWYVITESPYMVAGENHLPDGRTQRMTEIAVPRPAGY